MEQPAQDQLRAQLLELFERRAGLDEAAVRAALVDVHPADLAEALSDLPEEARHFVLSQTDSEYGADTLSHLAEFNEQAVEDYIEDVPVEELVRLVDESDPDDAVDLLEAADEAKAEAVLERLDSDQAAEVRQLRSYDPQTAGGIMTTEYLRAYPEETREAIFRRLEKEEDEIEEAGVLFVCDRPGRLRGYVKATDLMTAPPGASAGSLMDRGVLQVVASTDQEICARLMKKYDLAALPVVDEAQRLVGVITHDDILDVVEEEAQEDMYRLAGVGDAKPLEHGPFERAVKRLPWLAATLVGSGLIGPLIMHTWFHVTLQHIVVLAFFMPVIAGIGGNTAIQCSTIAVRGLATGEIEFGDLLWMLRREVAVAFIVALVCAGVIVAFAWGVLASGLDYTPSEVGVGRIAGTIGVSMFVAILGSVLLGTSIPMFCHRAGVDPALAAGPFITTLIDIGTQVIYLGLATWLLLRPAG